MKLLKNKKGDIAITLLVIGTFLIFTLALLNFFISDLNINNSFIGLDLMHKVNSQIESYSFYSSQGISEQSLNNQLEIIKEGETSYFYLEKTKSKGIFNREQVLLFSVKYEIPE